MADLYPEEARVLATTWHVVEDDVIGGWAVVDAAGYEWLSDVPAAVGGPREVCSGLWSKAVAEHVAGVHNAYLETAKRLGVLMGNVLGEGR